MRHFDTNIKLIFHNLRFLALDKWQQFSSFPEIPLTSNDVIYIYCFRMDHGCSEMPMSARENYIIQYEQ